VLLIFIALKNPVVSAGFESANLRFNGKHDNHYTTENDLFNLNLKAYEYSFIKNDKLFDISTVLILIKNYFLETGRCLRPDVKANVLNSVDRERPSNL
jgi:hypothetical protein